jgi:hypothetical protein
MLALGITIVKRPFVLDFAGAYLDTRPEFPPDVWADWEAEKREQFEGRWAMVEKILDAFEETRNLSARRLAQQHRICPSDDSVISAFFVAFVGFCKISANSC